MEYRVFDNTMSPVECIVFIENFRDGDRHVFMDKIHVVHFMQVCCGPTLQLSRRSRAICVFHRKYEGSGFRNWVEAHRKKMCNTGTFEIQTRGSVACDRRCGGLSATYFESLTDLRVVPEAGRPLQVGVFMDKFATPEPASGGCMRLIRVPSILERYHQ